MLFSMMRLDVSELVMIFNRSATGRMKQVAVLLKVVRVCIGVIVCEISHCQ